MILKPSIIFIISLHSDSTELAGKIRLQILREMNTYMRNYILMYCWNTCVQGDKGHMTLNLSSLYSHFQIVIFFDFPYQILFFPD